MFKIRGVMQKNNNFIKKVLKKEKSLKATVLSPIYIYYDSAFDYFWCSIDLY